MWFSRELGNATQLALLGDCPGFRRKPRMHFNGVEGHLFMVAAVGNYT